MPTPSPLITALALKTLLASNTPVMVFDCSFDLTDPNAGAAQYRQGHIPGALYVHLDHDLSAGSGASACGGRHPLPTRERCAAWLGSLGFAPHLHAIVYDRNGTMPALRLWWLLQWLGHTSVSVLDGGWQAWLDAGGAQAQGDTPAARAPSLFSAGPPQVRLLPVDAVQAQLQSPEQTLIDARATPRYRGETEPLDPIAGHIPGALNRPWMDNLAPDGRFKPAEQLRTEFDAVLQGRPATSVVHQCGSGVSGIHNLLAMQLAGYPPGALYAGGWSEWCSDPARPINTLSAR